MKVITFINRNAQLLFSVFVLLLLTTPLTLTYSEPFLGDPIWEHRFLLDDSMSFRIMLPLILYTIFLWFVKGKRRIYLLWFGLLITFLYSCLGIFALILPSLDSVPHIASYLLLFTFPLNRWYYKAGKKKI